MAGLLLVVFGFVRLGGAIKFIPYPVTIGFTSGIALIIFTGQMKDLLGLRMGEVPVDFIDKWRAFGAHAGTLNPWAVAVSIGALAIILGWPYVNRRIPGPFVALIATSALVHTSSPACSAPRSPSRCSARSSRFSRPSWRTG
jgi:SulP family sulfate permease